MQMQIASGAGEVYYDDVSLVLGGIPDRSTNYTSYPKGNGLAVHGTPTVSAVATGSDVMAISGFSSSNYLEQPYNADLSFGTGDFCYMGWVKVNTYNQGHLWNYAVTTENRENLMYTNSAGQLVFWTRDGANPNYSYYYSNEIIPLNTWVFVVGTRISGQMAIYQNGVKSTKYQERIHPPATGSNITLTSNTTARIGPNSFDGSIALPRISVTTPSPEQIKKIYEDEKPLFQENAKCTLNGSSDAVTALAYDDSTELLHVGTSGGRSTFQGLQRVDETSTSTTEISAQGGLIVEETA